ncbi:MAG: glycosyltransferase [Smithellaceae bacterium]
MENGIVNLSNRLSKDLFDVTVCSLKSLGPMSDRLEPHVTVVGMNFSEGRPTSFPLRLARFFHKVRPDVVHTHGFAGGSYTGIVGARLAGVPVIINGEHGSFFTKPHQVAIQRLLAAFCHRTLSVSESLGKEIVLKIGIPSRKIRVIRNGVDTDLFSGKYEKRSRHVRNLLKDHGVSVDEHTLLIGSIGSLKPQKNQKLLLEALLLLCSKSLFDGPKVVLVGNGPDYDNLKRFTLENHLQDRVALIGESDAVPQLLAAMDIFVSTSIATHEGLSNVILEAMSSGVPVISTKSVGSLELIQDGINGLLIDSDNLSSLVNCIELLLSKAPLRIEMANHARRMVYDRYGLDRMVTEYEQLYIELLKSRTLHRRPLSRSFSSG